MTSVKSSEIFADILFIDQGAPSDFNGKYMGLMIKDANGNALDKLPAGNYTVMIGSDKTAAIQAVKFTVGADKKTVAYGNVNGDVDDDGNAIITSMDASIVAQYAAKLITKFTDAAGNTLPTTVANVNGDVDDNGDNIITSMDASIIAQYAAKLITKFTDSQGNVLSTLEY